MKKILIINRKVEIEDSIAELKRVAEETGEIQVSTGCFSDINLLIDGENTCIKNEKTGEDLADFDKILCITTAPFERRHIFNAYGCYCRKKGVIMADDTFANASGKLYEMWRCWEHDVVVPKTAYGTKEFLGKCLVENFGGIGVFKSIRGTKGQDNYLVHSPEEISKIVDDNPDIEFILQEFIPNDGDYRIVTLGFEPYMAIYRSSGGKDHRNNTSLGGSAKIIPLEEVDPEILEMSRMAAKATNKRFAGVDVITHRDTGKNYILEVNHTPQVVTGAFIEEKYKVLRYYFLVDGQ